MNDIFAKAARTIVAMSLPALANAQGAREPIPADMAVAPTWVGRWHYHFTIDQPSMTADECSALIDSLGAARETAPRDALEGLVRETQAIRDLVAQGGRKKLLCQRLVTFAVASDTSFYERTDVDGGWQKDGSVGYSTQVLRAQDLLWTRQDSSRPEGIAQPFFIDRISGRQEPSNSLLACETHQHVLAINYCALRGTPSADGRNFTVDADTYAENPPAGLSLLYVGTSLVMRAHRSGDRSTYAITLFDDHGRSCKEWLSEWVGGRPRMLEERELFSAGSALNSIRRLKVVSHSPTPNVADALEFAMTPFERRTARDYRQPRSPEFDPTEGAPVLAAILAPEAITPEPTHAPNLDQPDHSPGNPAVPVVSLATLTSIPVHTEDEQPSRLGLGLFALVLLGATAGAAARWRRARAAATLTAVGLLALVISLTACTRAHAQADNRQPAQPAGDAHEIAPFEILPAILPIAQVSNPGEVRRYELALVNNSSEAIEVISVLPSCGCVGVDPNVQGMQLAPYDGKSFAISVTMKEFRNVNIEASWRVAGRPGRAEKVIAQLNIEP